MTALEARNLAQKNIAHNIDELMDDVYNDIERLSNGGNCRLFYDNRNPSLLFHSNDVTKEKAKEILEEKGYNVRINPASIKITW